MKGPYEVHFDDGSVERVTANTADEAKSIAKTARIRALDPAGAKLRADVLSHASVKVAKVCEAALVLLLGALAQGALLGLAYLETVWPGADLVTAHAGVLEIMAAQGTAIGATLAALAAVTGDSLQVPFFPESKKAWLLNLWADVQVAGTLRVRSAKMHDNVNGLRYDTAIADLSPALPYCVKQPLYSGDLLNIDLAGSAVAGDIEYVVLLRYFEELSAQHSRLITYDELMKRAVNVITVENTIATGTTATWTGAEAINAEIDQFHARSFYAIAGYQSDAQAAAIAYRGPDTANVRLGGPGLITERWMTASWFTDLARKTGMALIPVFNGDNKAATFIEALQDENGTDTTVSTTLVELSPQ